MGELQGQMILAKRSPRLYRYCKSVTPAAAPSKSGTFKLTKNLDSLTTPESDRSLGGLSTTRRVILGPNFPIVIWTYSGVLGNV